MMRRREVLVMAGSPVSCGSAGGCTASGNYTDSQGHQQGFVT